ncbi:TRAP transporter substrate-binding protein [Acuticoccus kandeliae]|uniref:TRAP transporter substrate-binding protein n=1 Tax=Acuticoccus kandeliae TaxID=2073160 RepID=UPI000D3E1E2E|nr:TRAP transporter substrate-binding protein [Acuticoccus kandeliae]
MRHIALSAAALAAAFVTAPVDAAEVTIRFPVEYSLAIAPGVANQEFKDLVEERTGGRVEVQLYPSGSLYKGLDLVQAILRGDAEMSTLTNAYWTALSPKLAVFELPYAFEDRRAFYDAIDDDGFIQNTYDEVTAKGAKVIAVLPYDHFAFASRETPIRGPESMAGQKIRGLGKINSAMVAATGAAPVSLNLTELSPALEQGVIDGLNAPIDIILAYKWYESAPNVTYAPVYLSFYPWMVNARWWDNLDPELRDIIQATAIEVGERHRARSEAVTQQAIEGLRAVGADVHVQTPEELEAWKAATAGVWEEFRPQIGDALIDEVRAYSAAP